MALTYPIPHVPMFGKGSVLLNLFDASGNPTGYQHVGNCRKFGITTTDDIAELYGSINKASSLIASALKQRKPEVAIEGTDFNSDHMAMATLGTKSTLAQTAQNLTAEALAAATVTKKGKYFRVLQRPMDVSLPANTVLHQGAGTLVAGTDYVVAD